MSNKEIFDKMAKSYDSEDRLKVIGHIYTELNNVVKNIVPAKRFIDFGCGTGEIGLKFVDDFEEVFFLDVSQNMLDVLEEKIKSRNVQNAETRVIKGSQLSINEADCIVVSQVLLHIPDTKATIEQLFNCLKKGGMLLVVDFDKNERVSSERVHNGFDQKELIALIKEVGFVEANAAIFYKSDNLFMREPAALFLLKAIK